VKDADAEQIRSRQLRLSGPEGRRCAEDPMMQPMKQLRLWHGLVAVLATATYLTDELKPVHQLLG
jgi:hypothetical protein